MLINFLSWFLDLFCSFFCDFRRLFLHHFFAFRLSHLLWSFECGFFFFFILMFLLLLPSLSLTVFFNFYVKDNCMSYIHFHRGSPRQWNRARSAQQEVLTKPERRNDTTECNQRFFSFFVFFIFFIYFIICCFFTVLYKFSIFLYFFTFLFILFILLLINQKPKKNQILRKKQKMVSNPTTWTRLVSANSNQFISLSRLVRLQNQQKALLFFFHPAALHQLGWFIW